MGDKIKVSVLEVNGVEENEGPCERSLTADIVEVNPAINGNDDVDAVLRDLAANGGGGDLCVGGVSASYIFMADQCIGGGDADGN